MIRRPPRSTRTDTLFPYTTLCLSLAALVLRRPHRLRDIFQVHLMADAGARRHGGEIVERLRSPAQELIAFHVSLIFKLDVFLERLWRAELAHHHRMVDDKVRSEERRVGKECVSTCRSRC